MALQTIQLLPPPIAIVHLRMLPPIAIVHLRMLPPIAIVHVRMMTSGRPRASSTRS